MPFDLSVVLVGSGFVAPYHLRGWLAVPCVSVRAIVTKDEAAGRERAAAFGIPKVYDDLDRALAETGPDAVDICSPHEWHLPHIEASAAAGADIVCQKPLALSLADAAAAALAARRAGVRLMVHENFRFRSWYRAAKDLLGSGAIGEPIYFRSDKRSAGTVLTAANPHEPWNLKRQPFFRDLERFILLESVIHQIDTARFLLGEPTSIYAKARHVSPHVAGEDLVSLVLGFAGFHGIIEQSFASKGYADPPVLSETMAIEGTDGLIAIDGAGTLTLIEDRPSGRSVREFPADISNAYADSYAHTIRHFVDCVRAGKPFETAPSDNLRTLDAVFAAYRSLESGQAVALPSLELAEALKADIE